MSDDKELDDLLDSALDDFDKKLTIEPQIVLNEKVTIEKTNLFIDDELDDDDRPKCSKLPSQVNNDNKQASSNPSEDELKLFDQIFNDEKTKESMKQFRDVFSNILNEDPSKVDSSKLFENLEKVMSELTNDDDDETDLFNTDPVELEKELDFIKNLSKNFQPPQASSNQTNQTNTQLYEDDIDEDDRKPQTQTSSNKSSLNKVLDQMTKNSEKLFNNLNDDLNTDDDLDSASSLMMEPILSMLFSKDILYPSLKLMLDNYDQYLDERKEKLSEEELKRLNDQKDCIKEMCSVYEQSKESDSKEAKSEQMKKILDLLEKCGMPPSELVPEVNPFEIFGDKSKQNQCPVS